jgi:arylsulfatase
MYIRWYADNMWLFVPVQEKIKAFFAGFDKYPYQAGTSLNAAGINYQTVKMAEALKRLGKVEEFALAARN